MGRFDFTIEYTYCDGDGELWLAPDTVSRTVCKNDSYPRTAPTVWLPTPLPVSSTSWAGDHHAPIDRRIHPPHGGHRHWWRQPRRRHELLHRERVMINPNGAFRKFRRNLNTKPTEDKSASSRQQCIRE